MQAILKTCIHVEERVGDIYDEFSRHPAADAELQKIWSMMADDEARHAQRIKVVSDRLMKAGVKEIPLDRTEIQALLDRAGEILQDALDQQLSIEEAIQATLELEVAFMKVHLAYGNYGRQPDLQTMFKALAEEDRKHTFGLQAYLERHNPKNRA